MRSRTQTKALQNRLDEMTGTLSELETEHRLFVMDHPEEIELLKQRIKEFEEIIRERKLIKQYK